MSKNNPETEANSGGKNKAAFKEYLKRFTSTGYISVLITTGNDYADEIKPYSSILEIDDVDDFKKANSAIRGNTNFNSYDKDHRQFPHYSLLHYGNFLFERTIRSDSKWLEEKAKTYSESSDEDKKLLDGFKKKYNPEELNKLDGVDLLNAIFPNKENKENLCQILIDDINFGSIDTNKKKISSEIKYKPFGLYSKKKGQWIDESGNILSKDGAVKLGKEIISRLVAGAKVIADAIKEQDSLSESNDYWKLDEKLKKETRGYSEKVWFLKYYFMIYPEFFSTYYTEDLQKKVLGVIGEEPEGSRLVRNGQIRLFAKARDISNVVFKKIFSEYHVVINTNNKEKSDDTDEGTDDTIIEKFGDNSETEQNFPLNRIFFGAPGTGKSFTLDQEKNELLGGDEDERRMRYERVTFHPDYSYANFVGTYKPVPCKDSDDNDIITYEYVPGPFMRTYVEAKKSERTGDPKPYLLIVEEINRANVAAVFGDVFQLLDRNSDGVSVYPIQASEDIKTYLARKEVLGGKREDYSEISIPSNMYIWATMNSADQGVFPMDTAFKRRWNFTYRGIDEGEKEIDGKKVTLGEGAYKRTVKWNELRKAINDKLLEFKVNEDKLMGPFFINLDGMMQEGNIIDPELFKDVFKNKVIMYLFDDAAKLRRKDLFKGCVEKYQNQYSKICEEFEKKGVFIFFKEISNKFSEQDEPAQQGAIASVAESSKVEQASQPENDSAKSGVSKE